MYNFFFQAEDGIRDAQESRGLGDVYKRQAVFQPFYMQFVHVAVSDRRFENRVVSGLHDLSYLSLIHI